MSATPGPSADDARTLAGNAWFEEEDDMVVEDEASNGKEVLGFLKKKRAIVQLFWISKCPV